MLEMFKNLVNYFFNIYLYAKNNNDSTLGETLLNTLRKAITENRDCNEWFMSQICDERYIEIHLLRCSVSASRQLVKQLIVCSVVTYLNYPDCKFVPEDIITRPAGEAYSSIPLINFVDARFNDSENNDGAVLSNSGSDEDFVLSPNYSNESDSWEDLSCVENMQKPSKSHVHESGVNENTTNAAVEDSAATDSAVDDSALSDSGSDESEAEEVLGTQNSDVSIQKDNNDNVYGEATNNESPDDTRFKRSPEFIERLKKNRSTIGNFIGHYITWLEFSSQYYWKNFVEYFQCLTEILNSSTLLESKRNKILNIINSQHILIRCINVALNEDAPNVEENSNLVKLPYMESSVHNIEANLTPVFELISVVVQNMSMHNIEYPPESLHWLKNVSFLALVADLAAEDMYASLSKGANNLVYDPSWSDNLIIQMIVVLSEDGYYTSLGACEVFICRLMHMLESLEDNTMAIGSLIVLWVILRIEDQYSDIRTERIVGNVGLPNPKAWNIVSCMSKWSRQMTVPNDRDAINPAVFNFFVSFCATIASGSDHIQGLFCRAAHLDENCRHIVIKFLPHNISHINGLLEEENEVSG